MSWRDSFSKLTSKTEGGLYSVSRVMALIAAIVLAAMMLLTVGDVVGRYFFDRPIKGTFELVGLLLVCAGTWGLAYCQLQKAHISISIFAERFPRRARAALSSLAYIIGLAGFSIVSWRVFALAFRYLSLSKGNITDTLRIPYFPFMLILAISTAVFALVLLADLIHSLFKAAKK
jgi:TRAP-type C4-dicarboxylate transport system permease small subunit